jgi:putative endonuclease
MPGYVYIITNKPKGVLYIGVTNDIARRVFEHRSGEVKGFTQHYNLHRLVWFEYHDEIATAIGHEKRLKEWKRDWKIDLIEKANPDWVDLAETLNS